MKQITHLFLLKFIWRSILFLVLLFTRSSKKLFWFCPVLNYFYFFIVSILLVCQMYSAIIEKKICHHNYSITCLSKRWCRSDNFTIYVYLCNLSFKLQDVIQYFIWSRFRASLVPTCKMLLRVCVIKVVSYCRTYL